MKSKNEVRACVVVLDHSVAQLRLTQDKLTQDKEGRQLVGVDLLPAAGRALDELAELGFEIEILVPRGFGLDEPQALRPYLPQASDFATLESASPTELARCAGATGRGGKAGLFVCADRALRGAAREAGFEPAPHLAIAVLQAREGRVRLVEIAGPSRFAERLDAIVPYACESRPGGSTWILAAAADSAIEGAHRRGLEVRVLALDLGVEDPHFLQYDTGEKQAFERRGKYGGRLLIAEETRGLVALGPDDVNELADVHGGAHGHARALAPDPDLMGPAESAAVAERRAHLRAARLYELLEDRRLIPVDFDISVLLRPLCPGSSASFQADVDRYSGAANLDGAGAVSSRHYRHPDNGRVVNALLAELNAMGYCAYTHSFVHGGRTLHNVIADLPGRGLYALKPQVLEKLREVLVLHPEPEPREAWLEQAREIFGGEIPGADELLAAAPREARLKLESLLAFEPWHRWWLRLCPLAGFGGQIVVVGCHLDSTAASSPPYDPTTDPAPGADDDASGIAATLALARHFAALQGSLRHTVRFCFFNAEESGRVGSQAYAAMLKGFNAPIKAAVCMDMIGYNSDANRIFEVHAGYTDATVRDASVPIADRIAAWAATLGRLAPAQIYKGTNGGSGTDRNVFDGAINRSDHASFHQQGYPAVVVSEDFFANLGGEPAADANPNYHRSNDLVIDSSYASDIACAVGLAVKELAS